MEQNKVTYYELSEEIHHQDYIQSQHNCALCGSNLELIHDVNKPDSLIREEAFCPECEIRTRAKIYGIH